LAGLLSFSLHDSRPVLVRLLQISLSVFIELLAHTQVVLHQEPAIHDLPPSPTNCSNFVHEQNGYGRQRDPGGQRVASKKVQGHACPAEACSY